MLPSLKPVRKCHACLLNLGDHCWKYAVPREQWRHGKHCPGFDNAALYAKFRVWQKRPTVKTRKELRQDSFQPRKLAAQRYKSGKKRAGKIEA